MESPNLHYSAGPFDFTPEKHPKPAAADNNFVIEDSLDLSGDLCVPYDDLAELEWLSNFVEESFSSEPENNWSNAIFPPRTVAEDVRFPRATYPDDEGLSNSQSSAGPDRVEHLRQLAGDDERRAKSKSFVESSGTIFRGIVPQKLERMNQQSMQRSNASLHSVGMLMRELAFEKAKRYTFDELATFTSNFDNEIGSGAFGNVYKGQFSDGTQVAVKVLKMHDVVHHSFLTEIRTMGKTDHQNVIKLIGFCLEENMLALVYEYMENGSLDKILYTKPLTLEWDKLYDIAVELANALAYLHHECGDQIIHHDIKASNVLLNSNHLPKLSDFGLANFKDKERTHLTLTKCRGTPGYVAPEIWMPFSPITTKADVYSFGMILFEILGTEKNNRTDIWFPSHVWEKFNSGTLDDLMMECGISEKDRKKAMILSLVALWCAQFTPQTRPSMSTVAIVLKNEILVKRPPNPFLPSDSSDPMQPV